MKKTLIMLWLFCILYTVQLHHFSVTFAQGTGVIAPTTIVGAVAWQPEGEKLLVRGRGDEDQWTVWVHNPAQPLVEFGSFDTPPSIAWSPDGTRFFAGRNIVSADTLEIIVTLDAASGIGGWSPDSTQVLAWADENFVLLGMFDATTGQLIRTISTSDAPPDAVSWSPDGAYFALVQPTGETNIISAQTGNLVTTVTMEYPIGLRWSPDSNYIAAAFLEQVEPGTQVILPNALEPTLVSVMIWDVSTGTIMAQFSGLQSIPTVVRWHPTQTEISVGTTNGLLYTFDYTSGQQPNVLLTSVVINSMDYSPFGGRLVLGGNAPRQSSSISQTEAIDVDLPLWVETVFDNTLIYLVPDPSLDRLADIQAACVADAPGVATLPAPESTPQPDAIAAVESLAAQDVTALTIDALPAYIAQVESLPEGSIPPACAADLIAVAEAVMAEGE